VYGLKGIKCCTQLVITSRKYYFLYIFRVLQLNNWRLQFCGKLQFIHSRYTSYNKVVSLEFHTSPQILHICTTCLITRAAFIYPEIQICIYGRACHTLMHEAIHLVTAQLPESLLMPRNGENVTRNYRVKHSSTSHAVPTASRVQQLHRSDTDTNSRGLQLTDARDVRGIYSLF
jgi:hypothetical protein